MCQIFCAYKEMVEISYMTFEHFSGLDIVKMYSINCKKKKN